MSSANEISLEGLTPLQKQLQLKFLECRRHRGDCHCFLKGQPHRPVCKKEKKLSRSWVKEREPNGPIETCHTCDIPPCNQFTCE